MTDYITTRLGELIDSAHQSMPSGNFYLEMPAQDWDALEESLTRSKMARQFMPTLLIWRGEYIVRGNAWKAWKALSAEESEI